MEGDVGKMTDKKDDGGPAFSYSSNVFPNYTGMSLRDYFAGMALQGIIPHDVEISMNDASLAASAYELADAMLAARKK